VLRPGISIRANPFSLYPADVYEDPLSVALTYAAGGQVRTTAPGADEIAIEIAFERLVHLQNQPAGNRSDQSLAARLGRSRPVLRLPGGRAQNPLHHQRHRGPEL